MSPPEISATSASLIVPIEASAFGARVLPGPLRGRQPQALVDRRIAHRRVGPQRDEDVEGRCTRPSHDVVEHAEHQVDRPAARLVGNDGQHPLVVEAPAGDLLAAERAHGRLVEPAPFRPAAGHVRPRRRR
jgi:hypothetical protein